MKYIGYITGTFVLILAVLTMFFGSDTVLGKELPMSINIMSVSLYVLGFLIIKTPYKIFLDGILLILLYLSVFMFVFSLSSGVEAYLRYDKNIGFSSLVFLIFSLLILHKIRGKKRNYK